MSGMYTFLSHKAIMESIRENLKKAVEPERDETANT